MKKAKKHNNHYLTIIILVLVSVLLANCSLLKGDKDRDGISNKKDRCPETAGVKELYGCPDIDRDGITDSEDECPEIVGLPIFRGCPDTDGDGITDSEDECPEIVGLPILRGCPDSDGDGIPDKEDRCPDVAGPIENYGCPWQDTDGDTILDKDDLCPDAKGTAANNGCPEVSSVITGFLPPAPTGKEVINMANFTNSKTLQGIADRLSHALDKQGYKANSFYRMDNDGFAIITQIEQTNKSWRSLTGSNRWVVGPNASVDPEKGFFGNLFYPNTGYYRCMIFVVHKKTQIPNSQNPPTQDLLKQEFKDGSPYLPDDLSPISSAGYKATVFIYQFEKPESEAQGHLLETSPNPGQNLTITGILNQLQQ